MSHARRHFWKCHKTLTFCSLLAGWRIPGACHTKPRFNVQKWRKHVVFWKCWLRNLLRATTAYTFWTSQLPKVLRGGGALYILTSTCASRYNGVHFFDISTSESGPTLRCCVCVDLEVCFAPQRRALFWHRRLCVLCMLTWKCASRHNGVQFFISHLTTWLRTRRFSEPTFRPSGATNHWKNTVFRTLSLLWSSLFGSSPLWLFPPLLFYLSIPVVPHKAVAEVSKIGNL